MFSNVTIENRKSVKKQIKKRFITFLGLILLILPLDLWGSDLKFSTDFQNITNLSQWYGVGSNAYKKLSVFNNLPGSGYPQNLITVCDKNGINEYHEIAIQTVDRGGSNTTALYLSTMKDDYPNRWSANVVPDKANPWTEYYQEWKVRYSNGFISRLRSGAYWNSQHTIMHDSLQTIVFQLVGNGTKVHTRFQLYDETSACADSKRGSNCGVGIDPNAINILSGTATGPFGRFLYITDDTKEIIGNKWYTFGIYYKAGVGDGGEIKFFLDGELILHFSGDTAGSVAMPMTIHYLKLYGSSQTMPHEMWIDDYKLYDGIPSNISSKEDFPNISGIAPPSNISIGAGQ